MQATVSTTQCFRCTQTTSVEIRKYKGKTLSNNFSMPWGDACDGVRATKFNIPVWYGGQNPQIDKSHYLLKDFSTLRNAKPHHILHCLFGWSYRFLAKKFFFSSLFHSLSVTTVWRTKYASRIIKQSPALCETPNWIEWKKILFRWRLSSHIFGCHLFLSFYHHCWVKFVFPKNFHLNRFLIIQIENISNGLTLFQFSSRDSIAISHVTTWGTREWEVAKKC